MKAYVEYDPTRTNPLLLQQASALGRKPKDDTNPNLEMPAEDFVRKYMIPAFMLAQEIGNLTAALHEEMKSAPVKAPFIPPTLPEKE